jgi:hypothetical protein
MHMQDADWSFQSRYSLSMHDVPAIQYSHRRFRIKGIQELRYVGRFLVNGTGQTRTLGQDFVRYPCEGFLLNTGWEIPHSIMSEPTGKGTMDAVHLLSICAIVTVASPIGRAVFQRKLGSL